jgi:cytoskeleton protein RodZ
MSIVVQMPLVVEPKERRLHLRDVSECVPEKTAGNALRERRLVLGLDEKAVASQLRIRKDQLVAIETGDYERLPGRTYAIGFIRSYARLVGLNAEQLVEQFKGEIQALEVHKPVDLVFPDAAPQRTWPSGHLFAVALVVAVVVYALVHLTMPSADTSPVAAIAESSVTVVDAVTPSVPVPPRAVLAPAPAVPAATSTPAASPEQAPAAPIAPLLHDAQLEAAQLIQGIGQMATVTPASSSTQTAPAESSGASRITLTALEETYVQVKDPSLKKPHAVLLARVLSPGESFQAPDREGLVLLTGNAGGVQVEVDGRSAGVLGKSGQVIKRLPLEPAYFLSRIGTSQ